MAAAAAKQEPQMPVFSYAQAAKGIAPAASATQSKAPAPLTDQKKPESATDPVEAQNLEQASTTDSQEVSVNGNKEQPSKPRESTTVEPETKPSVSGASSPSITATSAATLPKEDDTSFTPNGTSDSTWDKQSQVSSSVDRSSQATEVSKDKSTENGWDKEKNAPPAKELKAAPIPSINVWQQRREAQAAKVKVMTSANPPPSGTQGAKGPSAKSVGTQSGPNEPKSASKKKSTEAGAENASGRDRNKAADAKSKNGVLAPPNDAVFWPTPQSAQGETQKKAQDKVQPTEKPEKEKSAKGHGKEKWMPVPYVPTAVFNTPLPPAARRGGGRTGRGGRENGSHAPSSNTGDKAAGTSPTVSSSSKKPHPSERGNHDRGTTDNTKTPSQGPALNNAENTGRSGPRKGSQATHDHAHKDAKFGKQKEKPHSDREESRQNHPNSSENSLHSRQDSKSYSNKGHDLPNMRIHADNHGHTRFPHADRHFESGPRSADFHKDHNGFGQSRERDYSRNDIHRERGESRSERGRGGYRGRGGHSHYTGPQNPPYHSAPLGQHPFPPPKNFTLSNDRHRSHHHGGANGRANVRSPSMPSPAIYPPGVSPIQTDFNALYGYPQIPPGSLSAMPYQPYMEQFSLMSMISMQLEYYFSVDNLCKDLFLRKHMDSQGFVLLNVIANFKRIRSLTEDMELLRHVCRQLRDVECRHGDDGLDRLRKRDKWEQWVLNMESRDPSAQNDGPARHTGPPPRDGAFDSGMNPMQLDGQAPYTNGVNHSTPATMAPNQFVPNDALNMDPSSRQGKLSSAAPEFMPFVPQQQAPQEDNINVRNTADENSFPDDQVENLMIVLRGKGDSDSVQQSPLPTPSSRSFSFGSVDGYKAAGGTVVPENRFPFASRDIPSISEKFDVHRRRTSTDQADSFSVKSPTVSPTRPASTFWVKSRDAPIAPLPTDLVHESYNTFRERTLEMQQSSTAADGLEAMNLLYQFWSHFLIRNFNSKMYNEFKGLAFDHFSTKNSDTGVKHLIKFYEEALSSSSTVLPNGVVYDLVDLAGSELKEKEKEEKPVFRRLRSAWRNGAFNLKSRRKIDRVISDNLRTELER